MTKRGPDYAHELTPREHETLTLLLDRVGRPRPAARLRRSWTRPALAGLAVAATVLAVALVPQAMRPSSRPPAEIAGASALAHLLTELAETAARQPAGRQDEQHAVVVTVSGRPDRCLVQALDIAISSRALPYAAPYQPIPARVVVDHAQPPARAWAVAGCANQPWTSPERDPVRPGVNHDDVTDLVLSWEGWREQMASVGIDLPALPHPRLFAGKFDVTRIPDTATGAAEMLDQFVTSPGRWWAVLAEILAKPRSTPAQRAALLRLTAQRSALLPSVTSLPGLTTDSTGVTIRVPYDDMVDQPTTADLTFDPRSGRLLERVVRSPAGTPWRVEITTYAQS